MPKCELRHRCCCTCAYRFRLFDHAHFPRKHPIGWACAGFVFMEGDDAVYVGDFEHGLCELWVAREGAGGE